MVDGPMNASLCGLYSADRRCFRRHYRSNGVNVSVHRNTTDLFWPFLEAKTSDSTSGQPLRVAELIRSTDVWSKPSVL